MTGNSGRKGLKFLRGEKSDPILINFCELLTDNIVECLSKMISVNRFCCSVPVLSIWFLLFSLQDVPSVTNHCLLGYRNCLVSSSRRVSPYGPENTAVIDRLTLSFFLDNLLS